MFRCFQGSTASVDGGGYLSPRLYSAPPRARSPVISPVSEIGRAMTASLTASLVGLKEVFVIFVGAREVFVRFILLKESVKLFLFTVCTFQ